MQNKSYKLHRISVLLQTSSDKTGSSVRLLHTNRCQNIRGNREPKFFQSFNTEFISLVRLDRIYIKIYATVSFADTNKG